MKLYIKTILIFVALFVSFFIHESVHIIQMELSNIVYPCNISFFRDGIELYNFPVISIQPCWKTTNITEMNNYNNIINYNMEIEAYSIQTIFLVIIGYILFKRLK